MCQWNSVGPISDTRLGKYHVTTLKSSQLYCTTTAKMPVLFDEFLEL